jgi:hypothetical protein
VQWGTLLRPGPEMDPICTSACSSDADCPDGTLCGSVMDDEGRCFVRCEEDETCIELNNAVDNPLYCCPRAELAGQGEAVGSVCIQMSEPWRRFEQDGA